MVVSTEQAQFSIKPEKSAPQVDTSSWPLLLKVRTLQKVQTSQFCNEHVISSPWRALSL